MPQGGITMADYDGLTTDTRLFLSEKVRLCMSVA